MESPSAWLAGPFAGWRSMPRPLSSSVKTIRNVSQLFAARGRVIFMVSLGGETNLMVAQVADPRAWSAATVDESKRWYFPLSSKLLSDLRGVIAAQPEEKPITEILLTEK